MPYQRAQKFQCSGVGRGVGKRLSSNKSPSSVQSKEFISGCLKIKEGSSNAKHS
jgi:hypothetical protein